MWNDQFLPHWHSTSNGGDEDQNNDDGNNDYTDDGVGDDNDGSYEITYDNVDDLVKMSLTIVIILMMTTTL